MYKKILALCIMAIMIACGNSKKPDVEVPAVSLEKGKKTYNISCAVCHGADGKLGINGSKDITLSKMSLDERIALITTGKITEKGAMPAQGSILSADDIKAVAAYSMTLK